MRRGFGDLLWASFKSASNAVIAVVALVLSVGLWAYAPDTQVSLRAIVPVGTATLVVLLIAIVTLFSAAYESHRARGRQLPRVLQGREAFAGTSHVLVCWLEPSELFSYGIGVSFYSVCRQGFEVLIGIAAVVNVQDDGKIQVAMTDVEPGQERFTSRLRQNEREAVETTRVKPSVPVGYTSFPPRGGER